MAGNNRNRFGRSGGWKSGCMDLLPAEQKSRGDLTSSSRELGHRTTPSVHPWLSGTIVPLFPAPEASSCGCTWMRFYPGCRLVAPFKATAASPRPESLVLVAHKAHVETHHAPRVQTFVPWCHFFRPLCVKISGILDSTHLEVIESGH